jgi:hypothetical protein
MKRPRPDPLVRVIWHLLLPTCLEPSDHKTYQWIDIDQKCLPESEDLYRRRVQRAQVFGGGGEAHEKVLGGGVEGVGVLVHLIFG